MKRAYQAYTALFGHTERMNWIANNWLDEDITIHPTAQIGRLTQLHGNVEIGPDVSIATNCNIDATDESIYIGKGTNLNGWNNVIGNISIGKYCAIAPRARIRTDDHPTYHAGMQVDFYNEIGAEMSSDDAGGPVDIGNDVWICADSKIVSDVSIGDGAIIAANSVVTDDVEPYSLVAGNPAKHKKYRFDQETREQLQDVEWWNWSDEKVQKNKRFFEADLREVKDLSSLINE